MPDLGWYFHRFQAMGPGEILWRVSQKLIQYKEKRQFGNSYLSVVDHVFNNSLSSLSFNPEKLGLEFSKENHSILTDIYLPGGYDYRAYLKSWNAGFQTENVWPDTFSYGLSYKQNDAVGDARTNWELNRHFQFALLAKAYYVSGEVRFLEELKDLFVDWCTRNAFLRGISWTSTMEVAIRSISWMYALAFLDKSDCDDTKMKESFRVGILNMVAYVNDHYSRGSSANNHLLVEATSIGLAGLAFEKQEWVDLAYGILDEELEKQNYADGVNKEMSLHYQTFGMEAYLLFIHAYEKSCGKKVPDRWRDMLRKQAEFVAHSVWRDSVVCEFGDDDAGKILDLTGSKWEHWKYILQFCSLELGTRYDSFDVVNENISWLFTAGQIKGVQDCERYDSTHSRSFVEGGYSFLRDLSDKVLVGIDHAPLGFGAIAAHGHADALSFQMIVNGRPVFADPGTYIYHCDIESRNLFRKTVSHNALAVDGKDQSEMLGAFMWGRKNEVILEKSVLSEDVDYVSATENGYSPVLHERCFEFDKREDVLVIRDRLTEDCSWVFSLVVDPGCEVCETGDSVEITSGTDRVSVSFSSAVGEIRIENGHVSKEYGARTLCKVARFYGKGDGLVTRIEIK